MAEEKPKARKTYPCSGCGKENTYPKWVKLGDGKEYLVCTGRSYRYPSERCAKLALTKLKICPGCGAAGETEPGYICSTCEADVQRGRVARTDAKRQWYGLNTMAWFPSTYAAPGVHDAAERLGLDAFNHERDLLKAIADMISPNRREQERGPSWREGSEITEILPDGGKANRDGRHDEEFEGSPEQAEAVKTFLLLVRKAMQLQRMTGRAEGRSLLARLASGELTVNEFNSNSAKLEEEPQ